MKSETSFRVFFLKQHRKNSLKNIFFPSESVFLDFSFWPQGHRTWQNAHCAVQWSASQYIILCILIKCTVFSDHHYRDSHFDHHNKKCLKLYTLSGERHYHSAFADMGSSFICIAALSSILVQEIQHKIVQTPFSGEHNYNKVEKSIWEC